MDPELDTACDCGRDEEREYDRKREQRPREQREREEREYREKREHAVAESESLFGDLKRAAGIDTNKFVITVTYQTFSSGESNPKKVAVQQDDSFEVMLKQQFFVDILQHGPLLISEVKISSEKPERTYHVHKKLVKTLDVAAHQHDFKNLSMSIVQDLHIDLKFDAKKPTDKSDFAEALIKVAKWLNIKYVNCFFNGEEESLSGDKQQTSADDERILEDIFTLKNSDINARNSGKSGPYRALFMSNMPESTSLVVYRPQDKLGRPAHFSHATLLPTAEGNSNYTIRWDDTKQTDEYPQNFVFAVGAGDFANYQRILVPAHKAKVDALAAVRTAFADQPPPLPAPTDEYTDANAQAPAGGENYSGYADGGYHQGGRPAYNEGTRSSINYEGSSQKAVDTSTVTNINSRGGTDMTTTSNIYDRSGNVTAHTSNTSSCTLL